MQGSPDALIVKLTLWLTSTVLIMTGLTISPSLPGMQDYFAEVENSEFLVRFALTVSALLIVIGSPIAGQIVDRFGRKPLLVASVLVYGLAGGSGLVINSLFTLIGARAILGLAAAGVATSVTTLIADYYDEKARSRVMGLQSAFIGVGGFIFSSLGGVLADMNWRFPFAIYLSPLLLLPLIIGVLSEPNSHEMPSVANRQQQDPLPKLTIPWQLLGLVYAIEFLHLLTFYITPTQLPFYLKTEFNLPSNRSGFAVAALTLSQAVVSLAYAKIRGQLSHLQITGLAFTLAGLGYGAIALAGTYSVIVLGAMISGFGFGLLMPNAKVWLSAAVPEAIRGRSLGGLNTFFFLGEFASPVVVQPLVTALGIGNGYGVISSSLLFLGAIGLTVGSWRVVSQEN
ncbi:MAG: MFS transporter [Halothece sp.]